MRFARHLTAVVLIVGAVVAGGVAWNHFGASSLIGPGPGPGLAPGKRAPAGRLARGLPPGALIVRPAGAKPGQPGAVRMVKADGLDLGLASMLDPANLPYLQDTVVIEAAVAAGVVILNAGYRRRRRARRRSAPYRRGT